MPKFIVDKEELKQKLTPLQYSVTQESFTEKPFSGEYDTFFEGGIYSCIVCAEELFSSNTKFDSGCGWPAFFNSIDTSKLGFKADYKKAPRIRTEVTCGNCDAHLGHIFEDGPKPTGKRFCINSAALNFKNQNEIAG